MCACFGVDCTASTAAHVASLCCCREQLPDPDAPGPHHDLGAKPLVQRVYLALASGWRLPGWWFHSRPAPGPGLGRLLCLLGWWLNIRLAPGHRLGDEVYLQILAR